MLMVLVIVSAVAMVGLSHLFSSSRPTTIKSQPYESGIPPFGTARERFDVKFYLVAVLFIVFDIEVVFMLPWAVAFRHLDILGLGALGGLLEMAGFVVVLVVGYVYVWKRGALEWT
jgi:NADH-quinone oxidoreductase subunit A